MKEIGVQKKKSPAATVVILMGINLLAKLFGFAREILLAKFYGAGIYTDAYIIANNVPMVLFTAIGLSLATTYIPLYSEIRKKEGEDKAKAFTCSVLNILLIICLVLTVFAEVFTVEFVKIFAAGFQGETLALTVKYTRILFPSIFAMALLNVMGSYLQLHGEFFAIGFVPIPGNLFIILSLFVSYTYQNMDLFVYGTLAGLLVQILFYGFYLKRNKFYFKFRKVNIQDPYLKQMLLLIAPVFVGGAANEINMIVDRTLVSGLDVGSVSALNYASKINTLITAIFLVSALSLLYPKMAQLYVEGRHEKLASVLEQSLELAGLSMCLSISILFIFGEDIVKIFFERGSFDRHATSLTVQALLCYSIGLLGIGIREVSIKVFYSMQNTKTPMKNGIFCSCMNVLFSLLFIKFIGFQGAALATSISIMLSGFILLYLLKIKMLDFDLRRWSVSLIKTIVISCVTTVIGYCIRNTWKSFALNHVQYFIGTVGICVLCISLFVLMQYLFKNPVIAHMINEKRKKVYEK